MTRHTASLVITGHDLDFRGLAGGRDHSRREPAFDIAPVIAEEGFSAYHA